jgi:hypothetical protein
MIPTLPKICGRHQTNQSNDAKGVYPQCVGTYDFLTGVLGEYAEYTLGGFFLLTCSGARCYEKKPRRLRRP